MSNLTQRSDASLSEKSVGSYVFSRNDPFDRSAPVQMVMEPLMDSHSYMKSIRQFAVPTDGIAVWFFGQNGFVLKNADGTLIGIDLYLTNSCAETFSGKPFRLDRQLPIFVEPEDLDIDIFVTTHSHDDHADPETLQRLDKKRVQSFLGPWDAMRIYDRCGIPASRCQLLHPGQTLTLSDGTRIAATFALPTDNTDLNHTGTLIEFTNGIRFFNTGDTAYAERLHALLPVDADICTICINGGFHNLSPANAAAIVKSIRPRVVIPCHYDMMVNNVGDPEMFRMALEVIGADASYRMLRYYEPWVYRRVEYATVRRASEGTSF